MKYLVIGLVILALLLAAAIGAVSLLENRAMQIVQELRLAAAQDLGELRSTCAELIALVEHLPQMEKAYYFNIFAHCR